jgi:hypothetical protein
MIIINYCENIVYKLFVQVKLREIDCSMLQRIWVVFCACKQDKSGECHAFSVTDVTVLLLAILYYKCVNFIKNE